MWSEAVGNEALALRLFQTALDLSDTREGALFVVARDPQNVAALVAPVDRLDLPVASPSAPDMPSRRDLLHLLEGRSATDLDPSVLAALGSLDGATVITCDGRLLAAGAILRHRLSTTWRTAVASSKAHEPPPRCRPAGSVPY